MPFDFRDTFRVRHHECDANGHLSNAHYLRYIHETHLNAWASLGYGYNRMVSSGWRGNNSPVWQAREAYIDYLTPLYYGEPFQVRLQVESLDRESVLWAYEFRQDGSDQLCARGRVKYELHQAIGNQALPIPGEMAESLGPTDALSQGSQHIHMPTLAPAPPGAFSHRWEVEWRDVGLDRRLKLAAYMDYLLDFVLKAAAACGWSFKRSHEEGFASMIRRQWLRIIEPVMIEDELELMTWLSEIKPATVLRNFTIKRSGEDKMIGQAHMLWVCVDLETGRAIRIPESWRRDFAQQISGQASMEP